VQEHQGTIRAERNLPAGARFIIELRPATNLDGEPGESLNIAVPTEGAAA